MTLGRLGELVVELARRHRSGRVVRVIDPDQRDVVVELREIRQEPVLAPQGNRLHSCPGEAGTAFVHGVGRLAERHDATRGLEDLREREDRLLRPVRRHDLRLRIDRDAEAPLEPPGGGAAKLG